MTNHTVSGAPRRTVQVPTAIRLVFDMESHPAKLLGEYVTTDESVVIYMDAAGNNRTAPEDCVAVQLYQVARSGNV